MSAAILADPAPRATADGVRKEVGEIAAIEGLRGVAVLWVLLFHYLVLREGRFDDALVAALTAWQPLAAFARNGYLGVDLFFLITGFLLTLPWFRHAAEGRAAPAARAFYARRARRILPAYWVQLVFLFFVVLPLLHPRIWIESTAFVTGNLGAHATLLHYTTPLTSSSMTANGALWTLAIEAQYYLLLPVVAPLFVRWPWRCLLAAAVVAAGWRWLAAHHLDGIVAWYLKAGARAGVTEAGARHLLATQLPAWSLHFALGILAGRAWLHRRRPTSADAASIFALAVVPAAVAALYAALTFGTGILGEFGWIAFPATLAAALAGCVCWPSTFVSRVVAATPLRLLGRVSYSAYLYHLPLLLLFNAFLPEVPGGIAFVAWLAAVAGAAGLSHRSVEVPYLRNGPRSATIGRPDAGRRP